MVNAATQEDQLEELYESDEDNQQDPFTETQREQNIFEGLQFEEETQEVRESYSNPERMLHCDTRYVDKYMYNGKGCFND